MNRYISVLIALLLAIGFLGTTTSHVFAAESEELGLFLHLDAGAGSLSVLDSSQLSAVTYSLTDAFSSSLPAVDAYQSQNLGVTNAEIGATTGKFKIKIVPSILGTSDPALVSSAETGSFSDLGWWKTVFGGSDFENSSSGDGRGIVLVYCKAVSGSTFADGECPVGTTDFPIFADYSIGSGVSGLPINFSGRINEVATASDASISEVGVPYTAFPAITVGEVNALVARRVIPQIGFAPVVSTDGSSKRLQIFNSPAIISSILTKSGSPTNIIGLDFDYVISIFEPDSTYYMQLLAEGKDSSRALSSIITFNTLSVVDGTAIDTALVAEAGISGSGIGGISSAGATASETVDESVTFLGNLKCGLGVGIAGGRDSSFADCIIEVLYWIIYIPSRWILYAGGILLDVFVNFSISSKFYSEPVFILQGWTIVRDIANIGFIFGLLYIAIKLILNLGSSDTKKLLVHLVVVALLINFSLFFTRVVVDAGNILARVFYNEITITGPETDSFISSATGVEGKSLSRGFMQGLSLQKILSTSTIEKLKSSEGVEPDGGSATIALILIIGVVLNLIAAYVFIIVGLLFAGRILGLWFAMILSPIAFISHFIPQLKSQPRFGWDSWVKDLVSLSFMAPVFIFFIYLTLLFVQTDFVTSVLTNEAELNFFEFLVYLIIPFVFLIVLLLMSKKVAVQMSGEIGKTIAGVEGHVKTAVGGAGLVVAGIAAGATASAAGAVGRRTLGRAGSAIAGSDRVKGMQGSSNSLYRSLGRVTERLGKGAAGANYDARNVFTKDGKISAMGITMRTGKGVQGGFTEQQEKIKKRTQDRFDAIGTNLTDDEVQAKYGNMSPKYTEYQNKMREEVAKTLRQQVANNPALSAAEKITSLAEIDSYKDTGATLVDPALAAAARTEETDYKEGRTDPNTKEKEWANSAAELTEQRRENYLRPSVKTNISSVDAQIQGIRNMSSSTKATDSKKEELRKKRKKEGSQFEVKELQDLLSENKQFEITATANGKSVTEVIKDKIEAHKSSRNTAEINRDTEKQTASALGVEIAKLLSNGMSRTSPQVVALTNTKNDAINRAISHQREISTRDRDIQKYEAFTKRIDELSKKHGSLDYRAPASPPPGGTRGGGTGGGGGTPTP